MKDNIKHNQLLIQQQSQKQKELMKQQIIKAMNKCVNFEQNAIN